MSLAQKDIAIIEELMYKNSDDVAVCISRCIERLEDRIDLIRDDLDALGGILERKTSSFNLFT